ncbi:hypothetical protein [uncultured Chryseobacterium sp.]|uniref:hypothetical protein n=1 Tax=uncultured Chryseobacterium sp. TaxID=259322 RepID=UPI0025D2D377|nr:hypothetical protein [uncultured Chryseobacterium sp.]
MKKKWLLLLLPLSFSLSFGQVKEFPLKSENFSEVVLNKKMNFEGFIRKDIPFRLSFNYVVRNPEKQASYFVAGQYGAEGSTSEFLGEMVFTEKYDVKGDPDQMLVFGDFFFAGGKSATGSEMLKGKFRIQVNKNIQLAERFSTLTFRGKRKNGAGTAEAEVWWANYNPADISKVVFK